MSNGDLTAPKKGMSPLAWVAIGCGGLAILAVVLVIGVVGFGIFKAKEMAQDFQANPAKTAAETIVKLNPELDLMSTDDEAGTVTVKNNKTGEIATLNFEDIAEGKFSVTTDEGEFKMDVSETDDGGAVTFTGPEGEARFGASADLGDVPGWVPIYPGAAEAQGTFSSKTAEGLAGLVTAKTEDSSQQVLDHYKQWLEDNGYEIQGTSVNTTPQGSFSGISGTLEASGRMVNVGVIEQSGEETVVTINYNEGQK